METATDLDKTIKLLNRNLPVLQEKYPIARMALFGSIVRDDFDPDSSDFDILVSFNGQKGFGFMDLADDLEKMVGRKIDLVSLDGLKKSWWKEQVLKQAIYV